MARHTRYQGAIVEDGRMLLIRHQMHVPPRSYWVLPGGGIEPGESEEECVAREMMEETCLIVRVVRLLLDEPGEVGGEYQRRRTYLCEPIGGEAAPGYEPESEAAELYSIVEVRWFDLESEAGWEASLVADPVTYPQMARIRRTLGYQGS